MIFTKGMKVKVTKGNKEIGKVFEIGQIDTFKLPRTKLNIVNTYLYNKNKTFKINARNVEVVEE